MILELESCSIVLANMVDSRSIGVIVVQSK